MNFLKLKQKQKFYFHSEDNFLSENQNYYLKVINENKTMYAKSYIPGKPSISNLSVSKKYANNQRKITFKINNTNSSENYYILKLFAIDDDTIETEQYFTIYSTCIISSGNHSSYIFSDKNYETQDIEIKLFSEDNNFLSYVIELKNISKELFNYYKTLELYNAAYEGNIDIETGFVISSNPVTMYSNIENGYGIFAGYNVCRDTILIQKNL